MASDAVGRLRDPPPSCDGRLSHPLDCELHLLHPAVALVMYGTNDLEHVSARVFSHDLRRIVKRTVMAGTIPVLSTIPPRLDSRRLADRVPRLNRAIASIAETGHLPLWNYWRQLQAPGLANHGMDDDGMHPNVFRGDESTDLTARGLRYGYNQRNLGSLRVLEHLRRSVLAG